ncbi:MAG: hypothetical protein J5970_03780 [Bacilli bacterium]|nr:hypothetical protein [Bacilli bacterium]
MNFIKRIDDLGRIVIPKEVRRFLDIQNNENMEISINNNEIVLKKYNFLNKLEKNLIKLCNLVQNISNKIIVVTDRDKVIYSTIESIINKEISNKLKDNIINQKELDLNIHITDEYKIESNFIYKPLIIESNQVGLIILIGEDINEKDELLLEIVSKYINTI